MSLADLAAYFDCLHIAPGGWPVACTLAAPNAAAQARWPGFPEAATPAAGRMGSGCARHTDAAALKAVAEAVEIACLADWGDTPLHRASVAELAGPCWLPEELAGFSADQVGNRAFWNAEMAGLDEVPAPRPEDVPFDWVEARDSRTGTPLWLPAAHVLLGYRGPGGDTARADTNGCAAGRDDADARLSAVLELIERDATGRWWYGMRRAARYEPETQETVEVMDVLARAGLEPRLHDITSDIGVPVVAASGLAGGSLALGFAAGLSADCAARKALLEMAQMALKLVGARETGQSGPNLERWIAEAGPTVPPFDRTSDRTGTGGETGWTMQRLLRRLGELQIRLAFVDHTRADVGLPVWRAVSPDLCHWKPRFGRKRLQAPDAAGAPHAADAPNRVLLRL